MTACANLTEARGSNTFLGVISLETLTGSTEPHSKSSACSRGNHHRGHRSLAEQIGYLAMMASIFVLEMTIKWPFLLAGHFANRAGRVQHRLESRN